MSKPKNLLDFTLLYVEDDEDTRKSIAEVLALKVANLYVAKDGVEALEIFKNNKIQMIISDYQMPRMDGNELCENIKQINPSLPFVLLTAYNETVLLINAINAGVDKFLQKPIEAKKLFAILESIYDKLVKDFTLEKSIVYIKEAEKIAKLAYWDVDLHRKEITFSQEVQELFHLNCENITYRDILPYVQKKDKAKFVAIFKERVYVDKNIDETIVIKKSNHSNSYFHIIAKEWESSTCGTYHVTGLFQDVTYYEIQKFNHLNEVHSDPMLHIANKKFIAMELENFIKSSQRYGHPISVIFFDIDNFKSVNENYGHLRADDLLIELVNLIKNNIRQSDLFGRWGGDEFTIVNGYSSQDASIELANKIYNKIATYNWKCEISVTVSMGLSFYKVGDDALSLINRADIKMFEAKKAGKNRYSY